MGVNPQLNMKQMMPPPPQLPMVPAQPNGVGKRKADHTQEGEVIKRRRVKKPRDPDAPKRPPSSYLLFQNEVRQAMKKANPGMANHEILTNISQRWAEMSPEEKEVCAMTCRRRRVPDHIPQPDVQPAPGRSKGGLQEGENGVRRDEGWSGSSCPNPSPSHRTYPSSRR